MRFLTSASSIVLCFAFLAGCESVGLHDPTRHDQVPDDVKAQPRLVQSAPPLTGDEPWPRLGDVPMKPKDFSPPVAYNHYMDEMEYERDVGQDAKKKVEEQTPAPVSLPPAVPGMSPPQFQKE